LLSSIILVRSKKWYTLDNPFALGNDMMSEVCFLWSWVFVGIKVLIPWFWFTDCGVKTSQGFCLLVLACSLPRYTCLCFCWTEFSCRRTCPCQLQHYEPVLDCKSRICFWLLACFALFDFISEKRGAIFLLTLPLGTYCKFTYVICYSYRIMWNKVQSIVAPAR